MDLTEMLGSFGGVWEFFSSFFGIFLASFGSMNYLSHIANRFYTWNIPDSFLKEWDSRSEKGMTKDEIPIPRCLSIWQFYNTYVNCCCRTQAYRDYQNTLEIVEQDMFRNLDLLDLLRRLKMHGFALTS